MEDRQKEFTRGVLSLFTEISKIPRPSHHEEQISVFLANWCRERGFTVERDSVGNVIADVPATEGMEHSPLTLLQAHMDMVTVARPGSSYDPLRDGITLIQEGDDLRADGTTLGADDGIGVALILYIIDPANRLRHGPLRAVFTVDEEQSMTGAGNLQPRHAAGAVYCLNLDSEESDVITNSSACGVDMDLSRQPDSMAARGDRTLRISVDGLLGGHSGDRIGAGRCNAILALASFLRRLTEAEPVWKLASLTGGAARNAIPAAAEAVIVAQSGEVAHIAALAQEFTKEMQARYAETDGGFRLTVSAAEAAETVLTNAETETLLSLCGGLLNGVHTMSKSVPGLVESSSNLGLISVSPAEIHLALMPRSSDPEQARFIVSDHERRAKAAGMLVKTAYTAAAWPVKPDSPLVALASRVYKARFGKAPRVEAIHAGLECGRFSELNPELDIISIGPNVTGIHSPDETLFLPSAGKLVLWVADMLEAMKK